MSLTEKLYRNQDKEFLDKAWEEFLFFHPKLRWLNYKFVKQALDENDRNFFVNLIRMTYFPKQENDVVEEEFRKAMNKGINAVNSLCNQHLPKPDLFLINEIHPPLNLFELVHQAREEWIEGRRRDSKHPRDYAKILKAYDRIRAFGLGYNVKMLEESPEVLDSIRQYEMVLKWFDEALGFDGLKECGLETFCNTWNTRAGVDVYGAEVPMKSRLKILDNDNNLKYDSLMMKMYLKRAFPNIMTDHTGAEFIVEDDTARKQLINYLQNQLRITGRIESFKKQGRGKKSKKTSEHSSSDFGVVKFVLRPPIEVEPIAGYDLGSKVYERVPVEVQVLTLEDDKIRRMHPDVKHDAYKKKQLSRLFPLIFPEQIYKHLLD